ncbi:hypothetical protein [Streptomyces sp. NBC_01614]|uniref:hypothetical protein n=1 Tax=Streptomyces sp. NBC_01614 TaxID=2975897 RepID=UPI003865D19E
MDDPEAVGFAALVENTFVDRERHFMSERHEPLLMLLGQGAENTGPGNHSRLPFTMRPMGRPW